MKKLLPVLIIFFALNGFSQKEANFWYFGEGAGLDFNQSPPIAVLDGEINTLEGCSSFSNSDGALLFYSDGIVVYDKNHDLMQYSDGSLANNLKGDPSSTQAGMIVPKPNSSSIYYLFTVDDGPEFNNNNNITENGKGLNYYTIDMSKADGDGQLIDENSDGNFFTLLTPNNTTTLNNWTEKVAAVKGLECDVVWVVSAASNNFYAFKIDEFGVDANPVISNSNNIAESRGYLKLSPDGSKLAIANQPSKNGFGGYENGVYASLYNFNNETGAVTDNNTSLINNPALDGEPYGVEFSADSQKLYISTVSDFRRRLSDPAVSYKLFQFDLTETDIQNSKRIIHQQLARSADYPNGGFRGALQLGPDSKIYATIPLAYEDSSDTATPNGDAPFLDVIENPNAKAADIIFTKNAIDLNGKFATQGLPPFISSLLLPIEIIDSGTNNTINNEDLKFCIGQTKTIISQTVTGDNITYEWFFDNGSVNTSLSSVPNLVLNNLSFDDSGKYSLKIELTDDCGNVTQYNGTFNIEVFEAAVATKPTDIIFCDTDKNGFNDFALQAEKNDEILNGLDSATFEVRYFFSLADATENVNPLPNPYTNPSAFSSQTIHARVQNRNAVDACPVITEFILAVTDLPIPTQPTPLRICDDLVSGDDTDGIVDTFILSNKDNEIYGSLNTTQYTISYHTTQAGAEINDATTIIDKNENYTVTNTQTVYIRLENKDNTDCYDAEKTLELIVDSLPVLKANPVLEQCIGADNSNPTVNLTIAEINISDTANITFEYFEDAAATTQITDPTSYPVVVNTTQSIFVRVISEFNCPREIIELKIDVGQTPDNAYDELQTPLCDDFLDADGNDTAANSDTDNITNFSLDQDAIIASINPPINTQVLFYENIEDRNNTLNEIDITNYRNDNTKIDITNIAGGVQFPIYYKILSTINNNCQGLGQFYLQINAIPKASGTSLTPISECDTGDIDGNYTNGSSSNIDLTQRIEELFLGTNQDPTNFEVTFYKSEIAAASGDAASADYIDTPALFTNDIPSDFTVGDIVTQPIFVRIENTTTGCANPHTSFDVIINPLPIIAAVIPVLPFCDLGTKDGDLRNGLAQNIDVSIRDIAILGTRKPADFTITYHKTQADLENLSSTGIIKNSYDSDPTRITINSTTNESEENLFIRIINNKTDCVFDQSTLTIVINPEPTFETISVLSECDNNNDDDDDANGIVQNIDLNSKIPEILGDSQNPNDFNVTFHASKADATAGIGAINSPYENTNPIETIYVRVQNKRTSCVNDDATFDIIINSLPDFTVTTPQTLCLLDAPLNIAIENPQDIYSYEWKDESGTTIGTDETLNVFSGGTYRVIATTTNGTFCEREETIVIEESNPAILENSFVNIIDEGNNIGSENNLSISIDTINNNLGIGDYQFAILNTYNDERTPFIGFQEEPLFENLEGGIYQIIVNDKNGCVPNTTLLVSVIQFPKFFTPNGDGENDFWVIRGADKNFYPNASINVFNRFGKLIAQIPIDAEGWDGVYQGKVLPSDDYWYNITLIPADNTKPTITKKGNFSLLRK